MPPTRSSSDSIFHKRFAADIFAIAWYADRGAGDLVTNKGDKVGECEAYSDQALNCPVIGALYGSKQITCKSSIGIDDF